MEIGSRSAAKPRLLEYSRDGVDADMLGAGVGRAVQGLGEQLVNSSITSMQIRSMAEDRVRKQRRSLTDIEFLRWQTERNKETIARTNNMEPGASGLTNSIDSNMEASFEDFKTRTKLSEDPELLAEYQERFEQFRGSTATSVFKLELEEGNRFLQEQVSTLVDESRELIRTDPEAFDSEFQNISKIIDESALPPKVKEEVKKNAYNAMASTLFQKELERAQADELPVGEATGKNPVAPGLSAGAVGFLNATAGPESGGDYTIRYNGDGGGDGTPRHFNNFDDHPRIYSRRSDGRLSSAAGRYQFTAQQWDETVKDMQAAGIEINDFSPRNQDRAAWFLAQQRYRAATGRELSEVVNSGDREAIKGVRQVLAGTWEGFKNLSDDAFATAVLRGAREGGTGHSALPDLWTDPRFEALPYEVKLEMGAKADVQMNAFREQQAEATKQAEATLTDQLLLNFTLGNPDAGAAVDEAIAKGLLTDPANIERLYAKDKERVDLNASAFRAKQKLSQGGLFVKDDLEDLDAYYEKTGVLKGLQELDPGAITALRQSTTQTGLLPENIENTLSRLLNSSNPQQQNYALTALADIYETEPNAFGSSDLAQEAVVASTLSRYSSNPATALYNYNLLKTPEGQKLRETSDKLVDDLFEDWGPDNFFDKAVGFWEQNAPKLITGVPASTLPSNPADNLAFRTDYERLFRYYYPIFGNDTTATHDAVSQMMTSVWAPSPIDGSFMKNSPAASGMGVPTVGGTYDWIEPEVRRQVNAVPGSLISLVSDAQTVLDAKRGTATYQVVGQNEFGEFFLYPNRVKMQVPQSALTAEKVKGLMSQAAELREMAEGARFNNRFEDEKIYLKQADIVYNQARDLTQEGIREDLDLGRKQRKAAAWDRLMQIDLAYQNESQKTTLNVAELNRLRDERAAVLKEIEAIQ